MPAGSGRLRIGLAALGLFLLALGPRLSLPGRAVTADEDTWVGLTGNFAAALTRGRLQDTYQIGHPGVTALWASLAGLGLERAAAYAGTVVYDDRVAIRRAAASRPTLVDDLNAARRAHAVANALLAALCGLLAWRLFGLGPGLLTGGLLALDPFLVAHAQVIRMDSLQAGLLGVGLLCCLVRWTGQGGRWYLLAGGAALGLALLSKTSSAVIALPLLLGRAWQALAQVRAGRPARQEAGLLLADLALLGTATLFSALAAWPALWVAPLDTLQRMVDYTLWNGGAPPESGSFFLGRPVPDPGPAFYPVSLLFRLTPLTIVGLALAAYAARRLNLASQRHQAVAWLALTALLFLLVLTPAPKKADRYLLPIWAPLLVLASLGLWRAARAAGRRRGPVLTLLGLTLGSQLLWLPPRAPYALAFYNPLAGGAPAARQAIPLGWGEGLERAASALNARAGPTRPTAATLYSEPLQANLEGAALPLRRYAEAEVLVDYVNMDQRRLLPAELEAFQAGTSPAWQFELDGVWLVRIFDLPRATFGQALRIERQLLDEDRADRGERLLVTLHWRALEPRALRWRPQVALLDARGEQVVAGAASLAPAGPDTPAEEVFRLRLPHQRADLHLALAVLDEGGQPVEPTVVPPWAERRPDGLAFPSIAVLVR